MRKIFPFLFLAFTAALSTFAQTPQTVPYQAVARDATGNLLVNQNVCVQFSIYNQPSGGTLLYQEHHTVATNKLGLFNVSVGTGGVYDGGSASNLSGITWGSTGAYMEVALDVTGACSGYVTMGRSQMQSVPYALFAGSAASAGGAASGDLTGTYPAPTIAANKVTYADIQKETNATILGNNSGSAASPSELTLGTGLGFNGANQVINTKPDQTVTISGTGITVGGAYPSFSLTTNNNGTVTSVGTTSPITGGTISGSGTIACPTCATTTSGGALSATAPAAISNAGNITVGYDNSTIKVSGGNLYAVNTGTVTSVATTSPITGGTISGSGTIACATCVTSTSGGAISGTAPVAVSAAGVVSCPSCVTTTTLSGFAAPANKVGISAAAAGSASTAIRSDATLTIDQTIAPTWTGTHTFSNSTYSALFTGGNVGFGGYTTPTGAIGFNNSGNNNIAWGPGPYTSIYDNSNIHYWTDDVTNYESGSSGTTAQFNWVAGRTATGTGGTNWMELTNGELGIGTSPAQQLHVYNATSVEPEAQSGSASGYAGWLSINPNANYFAGINTGTSRYCIYDNINAAERISLQTNGNVGISTATPQYTFDLNGNATVRNGMILTGSPSSYIQYSTSGTANNTYSAFYGGIPELFVNGDNHTGGGLAISDDGGFYDYNDGYVTYNGSVGLKIAGSTGATSTGNLLIKNLGTGILKASADQVALATAADLSSLANGNFILNTSSQQASSNFNISGTGTAGGNLLASGYVAAGGTSGSILFSGTTAVNGGGSGGASFSSRPRIGDWGQWLTIGEPNGTNGGIIMQIEGTGGPSGLGIFTGTSSSLTASPSLRNCLDNGSGWVGIGTTSPKAPLQVALATSSSPYSTSNSVSCSHFGSTATSLTQQTTSLNNVNGAVAISASGDVVATGTITVASTLYYSDARIKDIKGESNNGADLATLDNIRITDYTMKDKLFWGNTPFKKVIAQQVEKVYPQAVTERTDFLPDVYAFASDVKKTDKGYIITIEKNLPELKSKVLRLEVHGAGTVEAQVISKLNDGQLLVSTPADITGKEVFVYGQQVSDFRAVDYDAIAMLNVSATQELHKQLKALQQENERLGCENETLKNAKADASDVNELKLQNTSLQNQMNALKELMEKNGIRSEK